MGIEGVGHGDSGDRAWGECDSQTSVFINGIGFQVCSH